MKLNILPVRADYHHRESSYREKFEIYLGGVNRGDVGGEESRVQTVSWSSKVTHTSWVCSPQKRWPPDPLTTPQPAPPHTHTPTHSHQLHLHLRFSSVASQQTEGGSGNHRGDRDSAFVSPDPLWENSVWPPWPSGCGVCVRAGNHCMMTMPYVIRHKLTFCPQEEHSLAFVLRRPTPRRVWGCGDERLDERASLLPRDDLEIVTQWFTSVQVELSLSPCLDLKKHPDDLLIRHVSPCVSQVCVFTEVCVQCVDFGVDLSLQRRPACWIPTGSTSLEIQGVERRPQNRGRHVWPTIVRPHTECSLWCVSERPFGFFIGDSVEL